MRRPIAIWVRTEDAPDGGATRKKLVIDEEAAETLRLAADLGNERRVDPRGSGHPAQRSRSPPAAWSGVVAPDGPAGAQAAKPDR